MSRHLERAPWRCASLRSALAVLLGVALGACVEPRADEHSPDEHSPTGPRSSIDSDGDSLFISPTELESLIDTDGDGFVDSPAAVREEPSDAIAVADDPIDVARDEPTTAPPSDYREVIPGNDVPFDMVWIEAGKFWIGRTEVTWDEYVPFCNFEGQDQLSDELLAAGVDAVSRPSKPLETFPYDREWGLGRRPAVGMSWNAAQKYCVWLSLRTGQQYRLPTEAEWQLACGAAPTGPIEDFAWIDDNSGDETQEVGQKQANEFGLHDMLGNLWEYTADPFDPAEPEFAALRGGSWLDPDSDATPESRLKFDDFWILPDPNVPPGVWWVPEGDHLGFRVVRSGADEP